MKTIPSFVFFSCLAFLPRTIHAWTTVAPERFSVAPMMGHTHRDYHYFLSLFLPPCTHYYTEMIPAVSIVRLLTKGTHSSVEDIMENVHSNRALQDLVKPALWNTAPRENNSSPITLQLGGRDPSTLATAAAVGAAFGYAGVNLNCGCPSASVASDRATGAALMREPDHVRDCLQAMSKAMENIQQQEEESSFQCELSVKHRLGVMDAVDYRVEEDQQQDDTAAYESCQRFVEAITDDTGVTKCIVHARLGLLGDAWGISGSSSTATSAMDENSKTKINHQRVAYQAAKRARQITRDNRSVPPLRPNVVNQLAQDFPSINFVTNGGIESVNDWQNRVDNKMLLHGGMVGRAVINHPCSFSNWNTNAKDVTRGEVLLNYIEYCRSVEQEHANDSMMAMTTPSSDSMERTLALRRRLIAAPFHLFVGEPGNAQYQRQIRKRASRLHCSSAAGILTAALGQLPRDSVDRVVLEFSMDQDDPSSLFVQRSGPLQTTVL